MHVLDVTRRGSWQEAWASGCSVGGAGVHVIGVKLSSASGCHGDSTWRLFRCGRVGMRGLILFLGGGSNEPRTGKCVKSCLVWSFWEFSPFSVCWPLRISLWVGKHSRKGWKLRGARDSPRYAVPVVPTQRKPFSPWRVAPQGRRKQPYAEQASRFRFQKFKLNVYYVLVMSYPFIQAGLQTRRWHSWYSGRGRDQRAPLFPNIPPELGTNLDSPPFEF